MMGLQGLKEGSEDSLGPNLRQKLKSETDWWHSDLEGGDDLDSGFVSQGWFDFVALAAGSTE